MLQRAEKFSSTTDLYKSLKYMYTHSLNSHIRFNMLKPNYRHFFLNVAPGRVEEKREALPTTFTSILALSPAIFSFHH